MSEPCTASDIISDEIQASLSETAIPEQSEAPSYEVETPTVFMPSTSAVDTPVPNEPEAPKTPPFRPYNRKLESTSRDNRRLRKKVEELKQTIRVLRNVSTATFSEMTKL